jgi:hypothetical protein
MNNLIGKNPQRREYAVQAEKMKARLVSWLESIIQNTLKESEKEKWFKLSAARKRKI